MAWIDDAFYIAAVLYAGNSNLLHLLLEADDSDIVTNIVSLEQIQQAAFDWGGLVQALDGRLMRPK